MTEPDSHDTPLPGPPATRRIRWLPEALLLVGITLMGAGADQWTKGWAVDRLGPLTPDSRGRLRSPWDKPPLEVIPGYFRCAITGNRGAIFGVGRNLSNQVKRPLLIAMTSLAMVFIALLIFFSRPEQRLRRIGLAAVLSGALGNVIDRVRMDYVVDFLDWYAGYNWPTFNVADVAISVGIGLVFIDLWVHPDPPPPRKEPVAEADPDADPETEKNA